MRRALSLLVVLAACGGGSNVESEPSAAPAADAAPETASAAASAAASATDVACNVALPGTETWKLVDAGDFTYCVPADWRVRGSRASYGGGHVQWRKGSADRRLPFVVGGVAGRSTPPPALPRGRSETVSEVIGGHAARLWTYPGERRLITGVEFTEPAMHFTGEAADERLVGVQHQVYRTIRFASR